MPRASWPELPVLGRPWADVLAELRLRPDDDGAAKFGDGFVLSVPDISTHFFCMRPLSTSSPSASGTHNHNHRRGVVRITFATAFNTFDTRYRRSYVPRFRGTTAVIGPSALYRIFSIEIAKSAAMRRPAGPFPSRLRCYCSPSPAPNALNSRTASAHGKIKCPNHVGRARATR